ncbi:MAG: CvpA family protein [Kiritimatiellia bacterium]|nr:CvpA family protein [Kiritimatiellia bacterium]MDP6629936.1 CvpA family protein [Kiritimatiellia bacterium]MDP6810134.1 CvpA family protein [Kiritimatiellia bacterium]MDP7023648.1 CvpA family protein [Kiritimatiellia bacterium]
MLNLVDIVALLFVLLHVVLSWRRGLSEEIGRVAGAVLAFWIGLRTHDGVAGWMTDHTRMEGEPARVVAYIGVVLLIILASLVLTLVVSKVIKLAIPDGIDKVGGGIAGLIKGAFYTAMIFLAMNLWPHEYLNRHFGEESALGSVVMKWIPALQEQMEEKGVTERVRDQVEASREKVEEVLKDEETKKEAGRIRKWFSRKK